MSEDINTNITKAKPGPKPPVKKKVLIPPGKEKEHATNEAVKAYNKMDLTYVAVYGCDEWTQQLVRGVWENTSINRVIMCDPIPEHLSAFSREMSGKRFSMHRWIPTSSKGFLSDLRWPTIIVAEEFYRDLRFSKKAKGIKLMTIEQLSKKKAK